MDGRVVYRAVISLDLGEWWIATHDISWSLVRRLVSMYRGTLSDEWARGGADILLISARVLIFGLTDGGVDLPSRSRVNANGMLEELIP